MTIARILKDKSVLIVGLGKTGLSVARYLKTHGISFSAADGHADSDGVKRVVSLYPDVTVLESFEEKQFSGFDVLIVSPGVPLTHPAVQAAKAKGAMIIGDIELFAQVVTKPVIAITGSNGKSTVVAMIGCMADQAGVKACVCGNFGLPVLDLVDDSSIDFYILELSSFQLETTFSLKAEAACILNISEDHLDRYIGVQEYVDAKQKIYENASALIVNRSDQRTWPRNSYPDADIVYFADDEPVEKSVFGLSRSTGEVCLMLGTQKLLAFSEMQVPGEHNAVNALAAIALGQRIELSMSDMLEGLKRFSGLPHRVQFVREKKGVRWFNDSKGTNVGATVRAIEGLDAPVVLIAGGVGKGADFSPLALVASQYLKAAVLIGRDATLIADALANTGVPVMFASTLAEAVSNADSLAISGDVVLFSPACSSFDMFKNFEERGEVYIKEVMRDVA